jgi:hypothetical protein
LLWFAIDKQFRRFTSKQQKNAGFETQSGIYRQKSALKHEFFVITIGNLESEYLVDLSHPEVRFTSAFREKTGFC